MSRLNAGDETHCCLKNKKDQITISIVLLIKTTHLHSFKYYWCDRNSVFAFAMYALYVHILCVLHFFALNMYRYCFFHLHLKLYRSTKYYLAFKKKHFRAYTDYYRLSLMIYKVWSYKHVLTYHTQGSALFLFWVAGELYGRPIWWAQ